MIYITVNFLDLIHIEISVPDAERAYQILHNVFGAEKVQEEFASFLDGENVKVIHVGLGDVVLQFIEPLAEGSSWDTQLKTKGAGVHNLTFGVESAEETANKLIGTRTEKESALEKRIKTLFNLDENETHEHYQNRIKKHITKLNEKELELINKSHTKGLRIKEIQGLTEKNLW